MNRIRLISPLAAAGVLAALLTSAPLNAQPTRADAEKDPVLKAMLTEMDRSMSQLQLKGFAKPFFIQYRIEDVEDFQARAEFGANEGTQRAHQRIARITVRVGNYKTDSSGGRGDGALQLSALDNDPIALRTALWAGTDQAYKAALSAYAQKQAALKQVQTPPQADDFSHEKPIISLNDTAALKIDEAAWTDRMAHVSGLYKDDPQAKSGDGAAQYSNAQFQGRVTNTWLVSSEGTIVRKSSEQYMEVLGIGAQAPDGMRLDRSYTSTGTLLKDLDTPRGLQQACDGDRRVVGRTAKGSPCGRGVPRTSPAERGRWHRYFARPSRGRPGCDTPATRNGSPYQRAIRLELSRECTSGIHGRCRRSNPQDF